MPPDFDQTVRNAALLANAYRCANPSCRVSILEAKAGVLSGTYKLGQVAHIRDARPRTPRYDASMSDAQRADISNALPLCLSCHGEVDSNSNLYPVLELQRWKRLSETLVNYARPILSLTPPLFLLRGLHGGLDLLGGHVLVGPVNLDAVCCDIRVELATVCGGVLSIFKSYGAAPGKPDSVELGADWKRFLARDGLDGLYVFRSLKSPMLLEYLRRTLICPYRVGCTLVYDGETMEFWSSWEALRVQEVRPDLSVFHATSLPWLGLFMSALRGLLITGKGWLSAFCSEFCVAWSDSVDRSIFDSLPWRSTDEWVAGGNLWKVDMELGGERGPKVKGLAVFNPTTCACMVLVDGGDTDQLLKLLAASATSFQWQRVAGGLVSDPQPLNEIAVLCNKALEASPPLGF